MRWRRRRSDSVFVGDLPTAERFVAMLVEHSERHALAVWQIWARCLRCSDQTRRAVTGLSLLRAALEDLRRTGSPR
jgi:hypothetical protein